MSAHLRRILNPHVGDCQSSDVRNIQEKHKEDVAENRKLNRGSSPLVSPDSLETSA
jgi:hypothetical protein